MDDLGRCVRALGLAFAALLALPADPPELFLMIGPTIDTPDGSRTMKLPPTLIVSDMPPSMTTPVAALMCTEPAEVIVSEPPASMSIAAPDATAIVLSHLTSRALATFTPVRPRP